MLTSFTDRRRRVWNVGDNAVVRLFNPTPRLFPCYVNVIAEHVNDQGNRETVVEVVVHVPSTAETRSATIRDVCGQLFPSFDTFNAEVTPSMAAHNRRAKLAVCATTCDKIPAFVIASVIPFLDAENAATLANWGEYLHEQRGAIGKADDACREAFGTLTEVLNAVEADLRRRVVVAAGRFLDPASLPCDACPEVVHLPKRCPVTTTTTTTSTTTTSCNTPKPADATTINPAAKRNRRKGNA